jgi:hypothetical protein
MTAKRRGRGEDSVYFDRANGCWVASVSLGFSVDGRRRRRTVRGRTKTEARDKLRQLREDIPVGIRMPAKYSVQRAVGDCCATGSMGGRPQRPLSTATS